MVAEQEAPSLLKWAVGVDSVWQSQRGCRAARLQDNGAAALLPEMLGEQNPDAGLERSASQPPSH